LRIGHAEAQAMFHHMGRVLEYTVSKTWTRDLPTDGVWLSGPGHIGIGRLPVVALEVVVTESPKQVRGSIATLTAVSPALGILLLQEEEIRRGLIRKGVEAVEIERRLARQQSQVEDQINRSQQRLELWSYARLRRRYEVVTGHHPNGMVASQSWPCRAQ
jgi:hypothetical protein